MILTSIEETLDTLDTKISWQDIANAAEISKSALSQFKKGTELKFPTLLKIAKFLYKKDFFNVIKTWCLNINHPKNIRYALEFLAVNKQADELCLLIDKIYNEHSSRELLDWADAYSILYSYIEGNDVSEILNKLRLYQGKTTETKILSSIIEVYCKNKMREYDSMAAITIGLEDSINEIKEDYVRQSYKLRLNEILAYVNLHKFNKPEVARKYAEEIISSEISAVVSTNAYYLIGMSYLYSNYDECLGNIMKYREQLKNLGRHRDVEIVDNNDLPFINSVWKKHTKRPVTSDISEVAHYEAMQGDKVLASELIDKAIEEYGVSGFKLYYKAIATGDNSLFMQSLIYFISKKGDKYFANLPYEHLKNDVTFKPMADLLFADE